LYKNIIINIWCKTVGIENKMSIQWVILCSKNVFVNTYFLYIKGELYSTSFEFVVNYREGQLQNFESSWGVQVKLINFKIVCV